MHCLAILGANGHAKVVADTAFLLHYDNVVFFDDAWPGKTSVGKWPVVGATNELIKSLSGFDTVIVGIGDNHTRLNKQNELASVDAPLANLIHPAAIISLFAQVGCGSVLFAGAIVNINAVLGNAVIVNTGATVDHDCVLADGVHVAPGSHLSGGVRIGTRSCIGVGACVRQGIHIGADVVVGAGAVVVSDIPDNATVVGNPARILLKG